MATKERGLVKAKSGTQASAAKKSKAKPSAATGQACGEPNIRKGDRGHINGKMPCMP